MVVLPVGVQVSSTAAWIVARHDIRAGLALPQDQQVMRARANCLYVRVLLAEKQPVLSHILNVVYAATWIQACKPCQRGNHGGCTGDCDCAKNGHKEVHP